MIMTNVVDVAEVDFGRHRQIVLLLDGRLEGCFVHMTVYGLLGLCLVLDGWLGQIDFPVFFL